MWEAGAFRGVLPSTTATWRRAQDRTNLFGRQGERMHIRAKSGK
jgi:hypothetical protein